MSGEEGFLARWSRRKRGLEGDELAEAAPPAAPSPAEAVPPAEAPAEAEPPADLPTLESLTADSSLAPFLRPGVPAALRGAALRRVWSLDPAIRDFVGPADYAWDFNAPDGVPGFALELGGDLRRLLAQAIGAPLEEEEGPAVAEAGPGSETAAEEVAEILPDLGPTAEPARLAEAPPEPAPTAARSPEAESAPPSRRHGGALPS